MPQPERPEVTRVSTSFGIDSRLQYWTHKRPTDMDGPEERPVSRSGGSAAGRARPPTSLPRSRRPPPGFRATVDAGRGLVEEHTPIEMLEPGEASRLLSELINRLLHIDSNTIYKRPV